MTEIVIPGTNATVEIDEQMLTIDERQVMRELPDLVPHSGENFGKPILQGDKS